MALNFIQLWRPISNHDMPADKYVEKKTRRKEIENHAGGTRSLVSSLLARTLASSLPRPSEYNQPFFNAINTVDI